MSWSRVGRCTVPLWVLWTLWEELTPTINYSCWRTMYRKGHFTTFADLLFMSVANAGWTCDVVILCCVSLPSCLFTCRYWVFRSWGRVGTTIGGNKLDKFPDKNSALDNFLGVYKEKTGNNWGSSNFTKYPNKFYPLEIDYGQVHTKKHWEICTMFYVFD